MTVLQYIGPHAEVEVAALGEFVKRGDSIEVPAELAGRAPSGDPTDDTFDPGGGLLAQVDNWQLVEAPKTKKATAGGATDTPADAGGITEEQ